MPLADTHSASRKPHKCQTLRRIWMVQDRATRASEDSGKSEVGSPPVAWIKTTWRSLDRLRNGIGLRLLAGVLLFSSAITLLLTCLQLYLDYRRDVGTIERRMSEIEGSYLRSLGEGLWNLDERQLELQVDGILHLPAIRFVEVREATDRADPMVVTAGSHQAGAAVHREFPIFHTVHGAEQRLGVLSIEATLDEVYRELLDRAIVILVSQGAKTFVVSFFILFIVHRLITRHLAAIARFLSGYDLRHSPPPLRLHRNLPQRADELDQLVEAFNGCPRACKPPMASCATASSASAIIPRRRPTGYGRPTGNIASPSSRSTAAPLGMTGASRSASVAGTLLPISRWSRKNGASTLQPLKRGEPFRDFVYKVQRIDGSLGFMSVSGKPVFDSEGRFSGYRGVASDLTDRIRAEQALQRSEAYLAEAQRPSHAGSWGWNVATHEITHWSQEIYRLYGFDPEAGIPPFEALLQRVHPDERAGLAEALETAYVTEQNSNWIFEWPFPMAQRNTSTK